MPEQETIPAPWVEIDETTFKDDERGEQIDIGETFGGWYRVDVVDEHRSPIGDGQTLEEAREVAFRYMRGELDHPDASTPVPLMSLIGRLNRVFEDELRDGDVPFEIYLSADDPGDGTRYRLRVGYVNNPEDGSSVSDLGPLFKDPDELRTFIRGLEMGGDGTVASKARTL